MSCTHTACKYCDLDIEGFHPYRRGEWRDRGNNTTCPHGPNKSGKHAPVRQEPAARPPKPAGPSRPKAAASTPRKVGGVGGKVQSHAQSPGACPLITRRRPHVEHWPEGYLESDLDYVLNNVLAAVWLLDRAGGRKL